MRSISSVLFAGVDAITNICLINLEFGRLLLSILGGLGRIATLIPNYRLNFLKAF